MAKYKLLNVEHDAKTVKDSKFGWLTGILYLAPSDESGVIDVCPNAGACRSVCLFSSGRGRFDATWNGRVRKTLLFVNWREEFYRQLRHDIETLIREARARGMRPVVRCNGTSDRPDIALTMANEFPEVQFYDYTKLPRPWLRVRPNYHLTQSFDPQTVPVSECVDALTHGVNVAVVFDVRKGEPLPATWQGFPVYDGDASDLRFTDPRGVVVGVRAKGEAKHDASGFVQIAAR